MLRTIRKENPELARLLVELRRASKAHDARVWAALAERLARPRHQANPVNVGHLDRVANEDETVVVPGKLLADGELHKRLTVAAFTSSAQAREKVHAVGGKLLTIPELLKARPDGTGVRLLA